MKLIARYITVLFLKNLCLSVLSLCALFYFQAVMGQIFENEFSIRQVLTYQSLQLSQTLIQMMAPGVLLATVLTFSNLSRTNELVACFSIGVGLRHMMSVILSLVFMVSCFSLVVQDRIAPPLYKKFTLYYWRDMKKRSDFFLDLKQDKIWYRAKNLIYNLQRYDVKNNVIHGMSIYTFDEDFHLKEVVSATTARHSATGKQNAWTLRDGTVTLFTSNDGFPLSQSFKEKEVFITETPTDFQEIEKESDGLRILELKRYIQKIKASGIDAKSYEVKFHSRWSLCFIPIVMCLLALPFSTRRRREGSVAKDLGICLVLIFAYWLTFSIGLSLGKNGTVAPWLGAWFPSVIFLSVTAGLLTAKKAQS